MRGFAGLNHGRHGRSRKLGWGGWLRLLDSGFRGLDSLRRRAWVGDEFGKLIYDAGFYDAFIFWLHMCDLTR